jgi:phospholipid-translocating ATPase
VEQKDTTKKVQGIFRHTTLPRTLQLATDIDCNSIQEEVTVSAGRHVDWGRSKWEDLCGFHLIKLVGDFVLLRNNESIPADIVVLSTSEASSVCYVETKNLDGETNLKIKKGVAELAYINSPTGCKGIRGYLDVEIPTTNLYTFNGALTVKHGNNLETSIAIGASGLLLRGCILRNTAWMIGIVVYTGVDTRIMLNSGPTPSKRSKIERQVNSQVIPD